MHLISRTNVVVDHQFNFPINSCTGIVQIALFIAVVCHVLLGFSRRSGDFIATMLYTLVGIAFSWMNGDLNAVQENILAELPRRIAEVVKRFNLDGQTTTYAVCPSCHSLHKAVFKSGSSTPQYPERCSNTILGKGECGTSLLQDGWLSGLTSKKPIKTFVYHNLDDFVGSLLSRSDLEEYIDKSCDNLAASIKEEEPRRSFVSDVFEADFLRSFEGPDSKKLFVDRGDEGRLAFALNVDFFNAEGLRIRGAKASCGIIALACLNLPSSIRYKPENMYLVGIIPGPFSPCSTDLNHYLAPVVDDLEESWKKGVHYNRTALYPNGRTVRAAIVCCICDLPGARKTAALASSKCHHHYCSLCDCTGKGTLGRVDREAWKERNPEEMRAHAEAWRDAATPGEQDELFKRHGVRWSELWRLPYWHPSRQLVVDVMHCVLEGMVPFHFRDTLKLTAVDAKKKERPAPAFSHYFRIPVAEGHPDYDSLPEDKKLNKAQISHVRLIHTSLTASLATNDNMEVDDDDDDEEHRDLEDLTEELSKRQLKSLRFICDDLGLQPLLDHPPQKAYRIHWARALAEWVCSFFFRYSVPCLM
jgi:hypothetical protein